MSVEASQDKTNEDKRTLSEAVAESKPIELVTDALSTLNATREQILEQLGQTITDVKPKLRGWFHLASVPLALIGGLALLIFTPTTEARAAIAVFVFASLMLFSISATYHRSNGWVNPKVTSFLQKTDHASISVLIAGTNTPFAVLLLSGEKQIMLLAGVWGATLLAVVSKYALQTTPRWINVPVYMALGWCPVFFVADLYRGALTYGSLAGIWIFSLIVAGGVLYTIGGILFGFKPRWLELKAGVFGFHEVFHLFTIMAFLCHYAAVSIVAYSL